MTRREYRRRFRALTGITVLTSALLVGSGLTGPASAAAERPSPGAAGIGDRLYPKLGNGGYDALHYDLALRYATAAPTQTVVGTENLLARSTQALSRFDLDFAGGGIRAVLVNGRPARFARQGEELVITPARPIRRGALFLTTVQGFTATPTEPDVPTPTVALVHSRDGQATAGQPDGEHYVYPSNDHPRDKATFTFRFDVPAGITAVANGEPVHRRTANGRTSWIYAMKQPMATELTQLAVGRYTVVDRGTVRGVRVRDVIPTRLLAKYRGLLDIERSQLVWLTDRVGPYPFAAYGSMVTSAPIGFALETQTLSIFDEPQFTENPKGSWASTMTHELAHQWFGDDVSPWSWDDIWLNEGHATWYETTYGAEKGYLAQDYDEFGTNDFDAFMKAVYALGDQYRADYGPVARLTGNSIDEQFNDNVYEGGALVLYALRQKVGAAAFGRIERAWVQRYSGRSASTDDYIALASRVSGRDLRGFLRSWVYGTTTPPMPGHPDWTVTPVTASAPSATTLALRPGPARRR